MQGNRASHHGKAEVSLFFSSYGGNLVYILELWRYWPFKTSVCSATSGLLSSYEGHLSNLHEAGEGNTVASRGEAGDRRSLSSCHSDLGILSIFKKSQALSPFEALNSACLSRYQRAVSPAVQMRRGPTAFSRVSTGDSDIPSSCVKKNVPVFKSLQGNPDFFRVRASLCPFHLR